MRLLLTISLLGWLATAQAESVQLLVQSSPLAGSQYYAVGEFWHELQVGDRLDLVREPANRYDRKAIRVEWRGHKLGYLPQAENLAVAAAMDRGDKLVARVSKLALHPDPWRRVQFDVFIEL